MTSLLRAACAALLIAASAVGCAPVGALATIDDAAAQLRAAEEAGALAKAPYEVWAARAYLDNARLARGLGDHRGAAAMARIARAHAADALNRAVSAPASAKAAPP